MMDVSRAALLAALSLVECGCGGGGDAGSPGAPIVTDPYAWQRSAVNPLIIPAKSGAPATTYEVSVADPCVLYDETAGSWRAWYSATRFDTALPGDPGRMLIRHAESADGVSWTVQAAPSLMARNHPADWDYTNCETPCVIRNPDAMAPAAQRWLMFYAGGNLDADVIAGKSTADGYPYYQIGLAYSADGRTFTRCTPGIGGKPGLALVASQALAGVAGYGDGLLADPEAVVVGGEIRLWCSSYGETAGRSPLAFGISHARSGDGLTWSFPAANPLASLYRPAELGGGAQPAVLYDAAQSRYDMWFTNDSAAEAALLPTSWFTAYGFWHAVSSDGVLWTPDYAARDFQWDAQHPNEVYGLLTGCSVARRAGEDRMYYCAWGTVGIPDPSLYTVPLRAGPTVPAVMTMGLAVRRTRPVAVSWRQRARLALGACVP